MKTTNNCRNGMCSNCGECCSDILHLSKEEIDTIEKYIKENNVKPSKYRIIDNGKPTMDLGCPFRDDVFKICKIYKVRPAICRVFKCDYTKEDIIKNRERLNGKKLPRSLRLVFFNDNRNQKMLYDEFKIKVYGKKE